MFQGSCSGSTSPPTTPSPTPPGPTPPSGCGSPQWQGDGYCDDDNNNEACEWDGGDCCGNHVDTTYCSACKCLDPTTTPTTTSTTTPTATTCGQVCWVQGQCDKLGCGHCMATHRCGPKPITPNHGGEPECEDIWNTKICQRKLKKGKCNKKWVKKNCQLTCGYCSHMQSNIRTLEISKFSDN